MQLFDANVCFLGLKLPFSCLKQSSCWTLAARLGSEYLFKADSPSGDVLKDAQ
jgi:hypothetical protein